MICVSIGRGRHRMLMQEHAELAKQDVQLVELRLDYIRRSVDVSRLLEAVSYTHLRAHET